LSWATAWAENVNILRNDFIGLGSQIETKADIWFVPDTSGGSLGNSGYAITAGWNKFGNEGQIAGNPRILVATYDGVTGTDRATYRPGTADTGRLCGINFVGNKVISIANPNAPFIKSYVSELVNWSARDNQFTGGTYTDFIQFPNGKTTSMLSASSDFEFTQAAGGVPDRFCTAQIGTLRDYAGFWPGDINRMPVHPFIDDPMITPIVSWPSANLFTYLPVQPLLPWPILMACRNMPQSSAACRRALLIPMAGRAACGRWKSRWHRRQAVH
jgi:hypothetical protein